MRDEDQDKNASRQRFENLLNVVTVPGISEPATLPNAQAGARQRSRADMARRAAEVLIAGKTVIKERFLLEELLGFGGMGSVYKARDLRKVEAQDPQPWVAIKLLNQDFEEHPEAQKALQGEVRKTQALVHPNILRVFDFDKDAGMVFMTMEFLQGQDLNHYIQHHQDGIALDEVLRITRQMGAALQYAHDNNIIHADFTPKNVFLTNDGSTRVLDFGVAQAVALVDLGAAEEDLTIYDHGTMGGLTPSYAGEERLQGMTPVAADDVFALGCIVYELLTGSHPYKGRPALEAAAWRIRPTRVDALAARQWRALQKAMALSRADRYQSVQEFLADFCPPVRSLMTFSTLTVAVATLFIGLLGYQLISGYLQEQERSIALQRQQDDLVEIQTEIEKGQVESVKDVERDRQEMLMGYLTLAETLLNNAQYDQAQRNLDSVREKAPQLPELVVLQVRLDESRESHRLQVRAQANRESEIQRLLGEADASIAAGKLVRPAGESALESLQQMQKLNPDHVQVRLLQQRLVQLHLDGVDEALRKLELQEAEIWLQDIAKLTPDNPSISRLRARLAQALAQIVERERQVGSLMAQARDYPGEEFADQRRALFLEVLAIDPANQAAATGLQAAVADITRIEQRRKELSLQNSQALLRHATELLDKKPATPDNFRQARELLLEARQTSPEFAAAGAALAGLPQRYLQTITRLIETRDYPKAKNFLQAAIMLEPQNTKLADLRKRLDTLMAEEELVVPTSF